MTHQHAGQAQRPWAEVKWDGGFWGICVTFGWDHGAMLDRAAYRKLIRDLRAARREMKRRQAITDHKRAVAQERQRASYAERRRAREGRPPDG